MGIAEKISRSELSDDLRHHEHDCAVDVLGAVGMGAASINPAYLAIYRLKYNNDRESMDTVKQTFIVWARNSMIRRKIDAGSAPRIAAQALQKWLFDVCQKCGGTGYPKITGTPSLSAKKCHACGGSGKVPLHAGPEISEVFRDVFDRAEIAVSMVLNTTRERLADK